jgi:hypothetical protein
MGTFVFPTRLFNPQSLRPTIVGAALDGGRSLAGENQFADFGGGGFWQVEFGETPLWRRRQMLAWRAIAVAADSGATDILVPLADRRHQPLTNPLTTPDLFGLSTYDDGLTPWAPDQVTAEVTADAALGQTQIAFAFTAPKPLLGGEHFSYEHATWGWRLHRISRVVSGGVGSGDATVVDFRPPLREAIVAAPTALLNFDSPRCLMRADGSIEPELSQLKFGRASARFKEAGKPVVVV